LFLVTIPTEHTVVLQSLTGTLSYRFVPAEKVSEEYNFVEYSVEIYIDKINKQAIPVPQESEIKYADWKKWILDLHGIHARAIEDFCEEELIWETDREEVRIHAQNIMSEHIGSSDWLTNHADKILQFSLSTMDVEPKDITRFVAPNQRHDWKELRKATLIAVTLCDLEKVWKDTVSVLEMS
jgi:hypothetical protein